MIIFIIDIKDDEKDIYQITKYRKRKLKDLVTLDA